MYATTSVIGTLALTNPYYKVMPLRNTYFSLRRKILGSYFCQNQDKSVPLSWEAFRNLTKDDDIRMLAEELTSSSNEEKEHTQEEKKGKGQETLAKTPKKEQKGNQERNQAAKTEGDKTTLTPREKRLQSRMERTEKFHVSEGTSKVATAKQDTVVLSISTGSQNSATGLSTGSLEKGQQKEKSAEILAKEVAYVLATLSTSIPSMNTHSFQGSDTI